MQPPKNPTVVNMGLFNQPFNPNKGVAELFLKENQINPPNKRRADRLQDALESSLLPAHTLQFVRNRTNYQLIRAILTDNKQALSEQIKSLNVENDDNDYQKLKEILILCCLLGNKDIISVLNPARINFDSEVLNMAIWSGDFVGDALSNFMNRVTPTYNSLRYAILSENSRVLEQVLDTNPKLSLTMEHSFAIKSVKSLQDRTAMERLFDDHTTNYENKGNSI